MPNTNSPKPNKLHEISAPVLLFIHSLPRFVFPLLTAGLLLGGLFATNSILGGVLLIMVGLILGWLIALSWSLLTPTARLMRSMVLFVTFAYAISRLIGGN